MREDDVVAARLRSVLAATTTGVRDQTATAAPRRILFGGPVARSRYEAALNELAEVGEPLNWSDVISGWPDDVDLDDLPEKGEAPPETPAAVEPEPPPVSELPAESEPPLESEPERTGGFRAGTPWASPPGALTGRRGHGVETASRQDVSAAARPGSCDHLGEVPSSPFDPFPTPPGEPMDETEPFRAPRPPSMRPASPERRPLPPPAWVLPEDPHETTSWPADPYPADPYPADPYSADPYPEEPEPETPLSSVGAFGGGRSEGERRFGLGAFDPGRRGVKALAAVAVVVLVIAALLAWRSRPQVDTIAPPSFATTDATTEPVGHVDTSAAASELVVAVGGKVRKPGLVRLPPGSRVADALTAAGGPEPGVDVALLNLARKVVDGELIMVGVTPPPGQVAPTGPAGSGAAAAPGGPVNLNTATLADLDGLPGVGPVLAQRILDAREAQGGFKAVSDLRKVDGIGDARYEQLKDLVTV